MFLLQRLATLSEESYEYGADVCGSRWGLLEEVFQLRCVDIFLHM